MKSSRKHLPYMRNHGSRALMENTPANPGTGVFWASRPSPTHILCRSSASYSPRAHAKRTRGRPINEFHHFESHFNNVFIHFWEPFSIIFGNLPKIIFCMKYKLIFVFLLSRAFSFGTFFDPMFLSLLFGFWSVIFPTLW